MDFCKRILVINLHLLLLNSCRGLQGQGLFLSLRGTPINNDSFVSVSDISAGNDALFCLTNNTDCCVQPMEFGNWIFPNGNIVDSFSDNGGSIHNDFFSRSRGEGVVRLNRFNNPSERGHFRCELLGDTIYVNILTIGPVSISPSTPVTVTVGETVNLQCSVDITPHPLPAGTSTPEFEWFHGRTPLASTTLHNGITYSSTLQLTSVSESDGGLYTCRLRGNHRTAVSTTVTVEPGKDGEMTTDNLSTKCSRATEIGTTAAVILAIMATIILCLVVALVVVIVLLYLTKRKKIATKSDYAVSANAAYGEKPSAVVE